MSSRIVPVGLQVLSAVKILIFSQYHLSSVLKSGNGVNSRTADNISCNDNLSSAQCLMTDSRPQLRKTKFSSLENTVRSPVARISENDDALFLRMQLVLRSNLVWDTG